MSFLIRRNLPRAWAGWGDNFARPPESPAAQPWGHYGTNKAFINSVEELQIPASYGTTGNGPSYEFQPYTKNFGMEFEMYWPVGGALAQGFNMPILGNWAKVGGSVTAGPLIHCDYTTFGSTLEVYAANSVFSISGIVASASTSNWGGVSTITVWIDDDKLVRVWRDDGTKLQVIMPPTHRTSLTRRGMNFFNDSQVPAYMRWIRVYDRASDFNNVLLFGPQWVSTFYDDFNRADGPVDNGWTQYGVNAGIVSGAWSTTGTTNGNRGIIRDTGITNGTMRIEGTINPGSVTSSLLLRGNSAGTDGLMFSIGDGVAQIARYTGALSSGTIPGSVYVTDTGVGNFTTPVVMAACTNGDYAWIEVDGVAITKCQLFGGPGGTYAGARVQRDGSDSPPWGALRISQANI